ncbi:DUF7344 domain-containing protein [Halorubrum sp. DTA98]|uniref:DUF7344 domain-containing protein n=1 Tax=Halorubrum sp. DTA98 TaxID=3402163 RepID=UPI003AAEDAB4
MASTTAVALGETFDVLTHPYRRYVLYYLRTQSEVVAIETLTAMITNELEGPSATGGSETSEHIETALHHTHLPKLADAGLITIEQDGQSIEFDGIHEHVRFIDQAARIDGYAPPVASN